MILLLTASPLTLLSDYPGLLMFTGCLCYQPWLGLLAIIFTSLPSCCQLLPVPDYSDSANILVSFHMANIQPGLGFDSIFNWTWHLHRGSPAVILLIRYQCSQFPAHSVYTLEFVPFLCPCRLFQCPGMLRLFFTLIFNFFGKFVTRGTMHPLLFPLGGGSV